MSKFSDIVFSLLFACIIIFLTLEGFTLFFFDDFQIMIDGGLGVSFLFLLIIVAGMTWVSYLFLKNTTYGNRLVYGGLAGIFAGLGVHWVVYATVTTLHSMSIDPASGYFINSLGISVRFFPILIGMLGVLFYKKIPSKSNIKIYVIANLLLYLLFPFLIFFWNSFHPWMEVFLFNSSLFFLLSKRDWIKEIKSPY